MGLIALSRKQSRKVKILRVHFTSLFEAQAAAAITLADVFRENYGMV